jgi:multidrug efflux pump subunit AcrA (membrane-fusion protein)
VPAEQRGYLAIEAIEPQDDFTTAQAPGRVEFRESAVSSLGAPVAGKVVKVHARDGELVHAGDPVVTLYSPAAAAARAPGRAESAARTAEDLLARQNDAVARGVGLEVERVEARAKRDEARVELERAKGTSLQLGPVVPVIAGLSIGGAPRVFTVRGYPVGAARGTRAFAGSFEYRAPLWAPGREEGPQTVRPATRPPSFRTAAHRSRATW